MSTVTRTRVAAALGLLSIVLSAVGLAIHGYPAIGESGKEIEIVWLEGGHTSFGPESLLYCFETMLGFADGVLTRKRTAK